MAEIISKAHAREVGLKHYFTNLPCRRGHIGNRFASTGACLECNREITNRWRKTHPDLIKERKRKSRVEHFSTEKANNAAWYAANKERRLSNNRKYVQENKEAVRETRREWKKRNPDKIRCYITARRARKANADGAFTSHDVAAIRKRQRDKCAYCRTKLNGRGQLDHIIALSKGGSNWPRNLQWLCLSCNASKCALDPVDFAQRRGLLL